MTFAEADKMWTASRKRKLANNTYLIKTGPNSYGVRLHFTVVVELHRDGRVVLNSGGWRTIMTKNRINQYAPDGSVYRKKFVWYFRDYLKGRRHSEDVEFVDYMSYRT